MGQPFQFIHQPIRLSIRMLLSNTELSRTKSGGGGGWFPMTLGPFEFCSKIPPPYLVISLVLLVDCQPIKFYRSKCVLSNTTDAKHHNFSFTGVSGAK